MAITIFLILNVTGVVFLLYVLVNFYKEGRQSTNAARQSATGFAQRNKTNVIVVTRPISVGTRGGFSLIPIEARGRGLSGKQRNRSFRDEAGQTPVKTERFSTR